jgi:hypothetical protein
MRKKGSTFKNIRIKMSKTIVKKAVAFAFFVIMSACGFLYAKINYVPLPLYEEQSMMPKMKEAYYVNEWCSADFGQQEYVLWDSTRVDCLTKDYAIEFDFAKKWAESVGQSLYYAKMTGKKPAVVLILTDMKDYRYVKRVERIDKGIKIFLIKAY